LTVPNILFAMANIAHIVYALPVVYALFAAKSALVGFANDIFVVIVVVVVNIFISAAVLLWSVLVSLDRVLIMILVLMSDDSLRPVSPLRTVSHRVGRVIGCPC